MIRVVKRQEYMYMSIFSLEILFLYPKTLFFQFKKLWLALTFGNSPLFLSSAPWIKKYKSRYLKFGTTKKPLKIRS